MDLTPDDPIESPRPVPAADPMATIVPYKNPKALTSYYLGLFSIFPVLGIFLGIGALVLGIQGIKFNSEFPESKGKAHAGVGIGCGTIGLLMNLAIVGLIVTALISSR